MRTLTLLALAAGLTLPAHAAQTQLTRPELCEASQRVVVAEVTDRESFWTDDGKIHTRVHLAVLQTLKGEETTDLDIELRGGQLDGLTYTIPEEALLLSNSQYMLFVGPVDGRVGVLGGEQGAVRLLPRGSVTGETLKSATESLGDCHAD